jgi:hypothetical protein
VIHLAKHNLMAMPVKFIGDVCISTSHERHSRYRTNKLKFMQSRPKRTHNTPCTLNLLFSTIYKTHPLVPSGVPRNFVPHGGFQQIQLRTEDRENGDLGAVAP